MTGRLPRGRMPAAQRAGEEAAGVSPESTAEPIGAVREAQAEWARRPIGERLAVIRQLRQRMASEPDRLLAAMRMPQKATAAEKLSQEVLPLADACRFVERRAAKLLTPRRLSTRHRPAWLHGCVVELTREPYGVVLVIAPWNYPLLLPGVQAVQALAAGNAVLVKPGRNSRAVIAVFAEMLCEAGLDRPLLQVLPEEAEAATAAIGAGVDKVLLTGSADTGRQVLATAAPHLIPATMELSGCDAVFVLADADLDRVAAALAFGLRLNGGATCISPRRVFVPRAIAIALEERLIDALRPLPPVAADPSAARRAVTLAEEAVGEGARLAFGELAVAERMQPLVLADAAATMRLLSSDVFAPVLAIVPVDDEAAALAAARACPYALGATIFGSPAAARRLAARVRAGCVVINDMIAPTADPRFPFGGRGESGFGVTRGAEGLLEMTQIKAIALRRSRWLPHLDPSGPFDEPLMRAYLAAAHARGWSRRCAAVGRLLRQLLLVAWSKGMPSATREQQ